MDDGWLDAVQVLGLKQLCAAFEPISDFGPMRAAHRAGPFDAPHYKYFLNPYRVCPGGKSLKAVNSSYSIFL